VELKQIWYVKLVIELRSQQNIIFAAKNAKGKDGKNIKRFADKE